MIAKDPDTIYVDDFEQLDRREEARQRLIANALQKAFERMLDEEPDTCVLIEKAIVAGVPPSVIRDDFKSIYDGTDPRRANLYYRVACHIYHAIGKSET